VSADDEKAREARDAREARADARPVGPAFFLRYASRTERGIIGYGSLEAAKAAAWDRRRDGRLRPVEILDWGMRPVMGRTALREWLDLQDRDWPEIEDGGELEDWGEAPDRDA